MQPSFPTEHSLLNFFAQPERRVTTASYTHTMGNADDVAPGKISAGVDRQPPKILGILDKKITKRHKRVRYLVKRADGRVGRWVAEKKLRIDKQALALIDEFEAGQVPTVPPVYVESSPAPYDTPVQAGHPRQPSPRSELGSPTTTKPARTQVPRQDTASAYNLKMIATPLRSAADSVARRPAVNVLCRRFMRNLDQINDDRFRWLRDFSKRFQDSRDEWVDRRKQWDAEVDATLVYMEEHGFGEEADALAGHLISKQSVSRPQDFKMVHFIGQGHQVIKFSGFYDTNDTGFDGRYIRSGARRHSGRHDASFCDNSEASSHSDAGSEVVSEHADPQFYQASGSETIPERDVFEFISLANPVDVSLHADCSSVSLNQIKRGLHTLFLSVSGSLFCITCPCPKVPVPALSIGPSASTHQLAPAYVSTDKIVDHFDRAHKERHVDLQQLVLKHGQQGALCPLLPLRCCQQVN